MRRIAILATVLSLGSFACDKPKPGEPATKTKTQPKTTEPKTTALGNEPIAGQLEAGAFDPASACDRQATLLEQQMKGVPDAAEPPEGWREPYIEACTAEMTQSLEIDPTGTHAYAKCLIGAEAPIVMNECMVEREQSRRRAKLASQTRAPLPSGPDACRVEPPLVRAAVQPPSTPHVQISSKAVCVDGAPVVALIDGAIDHGAVEQHTILALGIPVRNAILGRRQNSLTPEIYGPSGILEPVQLSIDKATQFATLVDVLYTIGREGGTEFWFAAQTGEVGEEAGGFVPVSPPRFEGIAQDPKPPGNAIVILESSLIIRSGDAEESTLELADASRPTTDPERWDLAGLDAALAKLAAKPSDGSVTISAENTIPFAIVAKVADAVRGPKCPLAADPTSWTTDNCRFPKVIIAAGG